MSIATSITNAFYRLASWAVIKYASRHPCPHFLLVDATYREIERKAQRVAEAAEALVAANEDYVATIEEARERLGIEVYE